MSGWKWKVYSLILWLGVEAAGVKVFAQEVTDPKAVADGGNGALIRDSRGFSVNPAGMTGMKDWDLSTATSLATSTKGAGFVFQGLALGKKLAENDFIAAQYLPGAVLKFVVPSNLRIGGVDISADSTFQYSEPVAIAFAHSFSDRFTLGLNGRFQSMSIADQQYRFNSDSTAIIPAQEQTTVESYLFDLGLHWRPARNLTIAAVGRELVRIDAGSLPSRLDGYRLPRGRRLELSAAWEAAPTVQIGGKVESDRYGSLGIDWSPLRELNVRGGAYAGSPEKPFLYALAAGAGWSFGPVELDASFLHFLEQENRSGTALSGAFDPGRLRTLGMSPFAADRLTLSMKAALGGVRANILRILEVSISGSVYPSAYETLAYRPIGEVRVTNTSSKPVLAHASFYVDHVMDLPTEGPGVPVGPGQTVEIPLTALFNQNVTAVADAELHEATVAVRASTDRGYDDRKQARVLIRGRNDWNGDVLTLRYFVRPDDPDVIRTSRDILLGGKDSLMLSGPAAQFRKARTLLNAFAGKMLYVNDPKQGVDYVQYPSETLRLKSGDCDDLSVCFASLLSSIGISTAFVDVVPPGHPEEGHIYLLFDTGIDPRYGASVAENPKRFVVRKNRAGAETIWIPVETTVIPGGFDDAWTKGAQEYFDDVEIGLGLVKGWVQIADVY